MSREDMTEVASPAEMALRHMGDEYATFLNDATVAERREAMLASGELTSDENELLEAMSGEQLISMDPKKAKEVASVIAKLKGPSAAK